MDARAPDDFEHGIDRQTRSGGAIRGDNEQRLVGDDEREGDAPEGEEHVYDVFYWTKIV